MQAIKLKKQYQINFTMEEKEIKTQVETDTVPSLLKKSSFFELVSKTSIEGAEYTESELAEGVFDNPITNELLSLGNKSISINFILNSIHSYSTSKCL